MISLLALLTQFAFAYDPEFKAVRDLYTGGIHYSELKKNPRPLELAAQSLSSIDDFTYSHMSIPEKKAFLVNAFNVFTIQWIVNHYPIKKVSETSSWFGSYSKKKFFKLLGSEQSLDGIRNDMLRFEFKDPLVLFTLCEGTKGGPVLALEPYTGAKWSEQVKRAEDAFMNDPTRALFDSTKMRFKISKYLKRYNKDFEEQPYMLLKNYLAQKLAKNEKEKSLMQDPRIVTEFFEWDDTLNDKP